MSSTLKARYNYSRCERAAATAMYLGLLALRVFVVLIMLQTSNAAAGGKVALLGFVLAYRDPLEVVS